MTRKFLFLFVLLMALFSASAFGVTVSCSAPTNNSTVATPVQFTCTGTPTSGHSITTWKIYVDTVDTTFTNSGGTNQLSTTVAMSAATHSVIVKAWDSTGALGSQTLSLTVTSSGTVTTTVTAPTSNSTVTNPTHFAASATTTAGTVTGWGIYVDNVEVWSTPGPVSTISQDITITAGVHTLTVKASNSNGASGSVDLTNVTVQDAATGGGGGGGSPPPPTGVNLNWTTSVNAETANNTSANDNWRGSYYNLGFGMDNNVAKAANTSRVSLHDVLYAGNQTQILLLDEPWWESRPFHTDCTSYTSYPQPDSNKSTGFHYCHSHPDIGVSSDDPVYAKKKIDDAMQRGLDGDYVNWYGPNRIEDWSMQALTKYAITLPPKADGTMPFIFQMDIDSGGVLAGNCSGAISNFNGTNCKDAADWVSGSTIASNSSCSSLTNQKQSTYTGSYTVTTDKATCYISKMFFAALYYSYKNYMTGTYSKIYQFKNGRPVVSWFTSTVSYVDGGGSTKTVNVDWSYIKSQAATYAGNPYFLFRTVGGYTHAATDGAFGWIGIDGTPFDTNYDEVLSYLTSSSSGLYYYAKNKYPSKLTQGAVWGAFNNRMATWACSTYPTCTKSLNGSGSDDFKITARKCGQTFYDSAKTANSWFSTSFPLWSLGVNTWNDYEEGSAVEPGIDNCWNINLPTIGGANGKTLTWVIAGYDPDGSGSYPNGGPDSASFAALETIHHFTVFVSDGVSAADGSERLSVLQDNVAVTETSPGNKTFSLDLSQYNLPTTTYHVYVKLQSQPFIHNSFVPGYAIYTTVGAQNQPPSANLQLNPTTGFTPLAVTADTSGSVDPDGTIASRVIDWGDGSATTTLTGTNTSATHTYSAAGTFTVGLTVTDDAGATATASGTVTPTNPAAAVAKMTVTPTSGVSPLTVNLDASASTPSSTATITTYTVDWGDGSAVATLSATTGSHTYNATSGTFTITLTITDSSGKTANTTQAITVSASSGSGGGTSGGQGTIDIPTLADNAFVFSPVRVLATANSTTPGTVIPRLDMFVDGTNVFSATYGVNQLQSTEAMNDSVWSLIDGITVSPDVVANPVDGAITADQFNYINTSAAQFATQTGTVTVAAGSTVTFSVWLRTSVGNPDTTIAIGVQNSGGTETWGVADYTVNSTWTRYTVTGTATSTSLPRVVIGGFGTLSNYPASNFLAWGSQLEFGSAATAYESVGVRPTGPEAINPVTLDHYVFASVGAWHDITVQATDSNGGTFSKTVHVFAEGSNQ